MSEGLKQREFIPDVSLQPEQKKPVKRERGAEIFEKKRLQAQKARDSERTEAGKGQETKQSAEIPKPQSNKTTQKQGVLSANVVYSAATEEPLSEQVKATLHETEPPSEKVTDILHETEPVYGRAPKHDAVTPSRADTVVRPVQQSLFEEGELAEQTLRELRIVGQVFSTYWILQYDDAMYLVDQHAAHEKVLYERFMKQLCEKEPMTQMLEPPTLLSVSMQEEQVLKEHLPWIETLGFRIEPFGGREYAVSGIPAHLPTVEIQSLLLEILALLAEQHGKRTPEVLLDKVASMSCKAAVKGNHLLDARQAEELMQELMTLENPYHCPHGRPTMIRMTKRELEKKFKRIV